MMRRVVLLLFVPALVSAGWVTAQPPEVSLVEGFRMVEVASVSDAMEQLYGQRAYMSHDMRPLSPSKFAGPAVTVQLKKESTRKALPPREECWTPLTLLRQDPSTSWCSKTAATMPASEA